MENYLNSTSFIDCDQPLIRAKALELVEGLSSEPEKAKKLFYFVRDNIKYSPYAPRFKPSDLKASFVLSKGEGYCVHKAILLVALARASGIPARPGFAAIRNYQTPKKLFEIRNSDVFPWHGYAILFLKGKWVKVTPTYNLDICLKGNFDPVEFDGEHDAMLPAYNNSGQKLVEYLLDRGPFDDVPFDEIYQASIWVKTVKSNSKED